MASYHAVTRATFARQDRDRAEARAYQRKHGLVRRGMELRLEYLQRLYRHYTPMLNDPHPLQRHHAGTELAKILREVRGLQARIGRV